MKRTLLYEKYRPKSFEDYVISDPILKNQIESWLEHRSFPHLLISGPPGTGKTCLADLVVKTLFKYADYQLTGSANRSFKGYVKYNAGITNGIDTVIQSEK